MKKNPRHISAKQLAGLHLFAKVDWAVTVMQKNGLRKRHYPWAYWKIALRHKVAASFIRFVFPKPEQRQLKALVAGAAAQYQRLGFTR